MALAHRRIKATPDELEAALRGRVNRHHRFLSQLHLQPIDAVSAATDQIDTRRWRTRKDELTLNFVDPDPAGDFDP